MSCVPSWTETLIWAGAEVVGRTRFCIHPQEKIRFIPVVGGTKDLDWKRVAELNPDILILDREENPKTFAVQNEFAWHSSCVRSVHEMPQELSALADVFADQPQVAEKLKQLAQRWKNVLLQKQLLFDRAVFSDREFEWLRHPSEVPDLVKNPKVLYMIWRDPWMSVGPETFIASMLQLFSLELAIDGSFGAYPKIDPLQFLANDTVLLFSSEPFPFKKFAKDLLQLPHAMALVDGEKLSWFGLRSLVFLEAQHTL